jgi:hypothetical protein
LQPTLEAVESIISHKEALKKLLPVIDEATLYFRAMIAATPLRSPNSAISTLEKPASVSQARRPAPKILTESRANPLSFATIPGVEEL